MTSFMLAYHVHEKAIMTAIIPMVFLAFTCEDCARLFLRMSTVGHFGLMPLLYEPAEFFVKVLLNGCYLALGIWILEGVHGKQRKANLLQRCDQVGLAVMVFLVAYAEGFHTILFGDNTLEFLPLMMISFFCAIGMVYCWIQSGIIMVKSLDFCIE
jgi:alpha-1,3-glucosyltransferase